MKPEETALGEGTATTALAYANALRASTDLHATSSQ